MIRLLFFLVLVLAAGVWLRRFLGRDDAAPDREPRVRDSMVPCGYCRLYVPLASAVRSADDRYFCCAEHARGVDPEQRTR